MEEKDRFSDKEIYDKFEKVLNRKERELYIQLIGSILRFLIEIAVVVAVIWLVYKQCSS